MHDVLAWWGVPTALVVVALLAWWVGALAERLGSLFILAANLAAEALLAVTYPHFPSAGMFVIDFALACGLLGVALGYGNYWLGVAMFLQSLALCLQGLDLAGEGPSMLTHIIANNFISYGMLACIIGGVVGSWRSKVAKRAARLASANVSPVDQPAMITF